MDNLANGKRWSTIEISSRDSQHRVNEMATDPAKTTSVHSRPALIYLIAKGYVRETVTDAGNPDPAIEIEELTDPPPSNETAGDEPVIITFSYAVWANNPSHPDF